MNLRRVLPLFAAASIACSHSASLPDSGATAPQDAGIDGGTNLGADAGMDGGRDGGPVALDAGHDAGPDAGRDAGSDGGLNGGRDAGADAGLDAGHDGGTDAGLDAGLNTVPDAGYAQFCELPGSVVYTDGGSYTVPGAVDAGQTDFSWLTLPPGFCVHHYAVVPNARQIRFAPGGELFVSSPTNRTVSGGQNGLGAIAVVPDDDGDGFGDNILIFESSLPSTQGMLFANASFYYQDDTQIISEPYVTGQRFDNGNHSVAVDVTVYESATHWPKTLDISDTGEIFVGNGGNAVAACVQPSPFQGGILQIDGTDGGTQVVSGLRNPIAVKCHRDGNNRCFSTELARDYTASKGGREKLLEINPGDDWGYPCCASTNVPYEGFTTPCGDAGQQCTPDCSAVTQDTNSFLIGNTPFGFDFVDNQFPAPWNDMVIVGLHGAYQTWAGARLVAIGFDPSTGLLLPSTDTDGGYDSGSLTDFATGWDDGAQDHGRPTDVEMSPDGRLFVADDQLGEIFWIASTSQ